MFIDFEKWHGTKNDFIVTWILATDRDLLVPTFERLAPRICNRDGAGVSADGILVLVSKTRLSPFPEELVIINSDGSQAKNCGNGIRCAAMSCREKAYQSGVEDFDGVTLNVQGVEISCRFIGGDEACLVAVTMPSPLVNNQNDWHSEIMDLLNQVNLPTQNQIKESYSVSLGNPHLVLLNDSPSSEAAIRFGKPLQKFRQGDGINVHVATEMVVTDKLDRQCFRELGESVTEMFQVFPFERGAGLTQSCGTGACAVAVAALSSGLIDRSGWVGVLMPGGLLYVRQDQEHEPVILAGPAEKVFVGKLEI